MDKVDIQIIDYLWELPSDTAFLLSPHADEIFNMPAINAEEGVIRERINSLIMQGYLKLFPHEGLKSVESGIIGLNVIGLTAKGAKLWESIFLPDWSRYVLAISYYIEGNHNGYIEEYNISAISNDKLDEILCSIRDKLSHGFSLNRVSPWSATYWKSFDRGYELKLTVTEPSISDFINSYLCSLPKDWRLPPVI
ncbi:MAG: hypothetical protein HZT40_01580 [Candidatus Thiothrix singaporensis]|uniref:Uncharacterized protein n=1 Tax=Candidatus Thiothrix singaporensis TaxID=2799669 RepID=A0A7L6ANA1_9GAMM|nr:MAG: hypothetical protein HZT40_01580 [Candidatus Thiothrix singaporensis]